MVAESNRGVAGPLFVVGMPRSGTKLLRELLGRHPKIRFSNIETEFFPYWVSNWQELLPIADAEHFGKFYQRCLALPFFIQNSLQEVEIDEEQWMKACDSFTPAGVFSGLMRCYLAIPISDHETIWGDKSPSYIRHVPLLMSEFPAARVVHITRDVRDYALSISKAWGKSILRAAQRWQDDVSKVREEGRRFVGRYVEIRYEDLLDDPRNALEKICKVMNLEFDVRMLDPGRAVENLGAATNARTLVRDNAGKYLQQMSPALIARVEKIAGTTLRDLGYKCTYEGVPVRVATWRLWLFQITDGVNLILANAGRFGLIRSVRFHLASFRTSGNRR